MEKELKVKAIERTVKSGKEKGKKFLAYKVKNIVSGYYEELRFNRKTSKKPEEEGTFVLVCDSENINRIGTSSRDYPLTWVKDVKEIRTWTKEQANTDDDHEEEPLPF